MSIYQFGYVIKSRREELGYTQEELADGICSVPTLSRIENGERMPSKAHFEMLLQRLGCSDTILYEYVDERTLTKHELKFKIRQGVITNHKEESRRLLEQFKTAADESSPIDRQFILLHELLSDTAHGNVEDRLIQFENALRLTCPKYSEERLPKFLSYEEILILNNIAGCYLAMEQIERAIRILGYLKAYYETGISNMEECLRTQPMILYNLSKCLGLAGRYDECIEICDLGIKLARETGRCVALASTLYNRAWSLAKRGQSGDMEQAEEAARLALSMADVMGKDTAAEKYRQFIETTFPRSGMPEKE